MIPVQAKVTDPSKIIVQKIFIANKMAPLAIQRDEQNQSEYKVLFKLDENITGNFIYLEIRLKAEDNFDKSYIESKSIYLDNIKKDDKKYEAFKTIMKDFNPDIFFIGDFNIIRNDSEMNYSINAIRSLTPDGQNFFFELNKIYIPRYMYIILTLYLQELLDPYSDNENELLFVANDVMNMRFEKAENMKLIASTKKEIDNAFSYSTMYEMNCGPTSWKFIYEIITTEDLKLKEPLFSSIFNAEYSQYYNNFIGSVPDRGFVYIIVRNDQNKVVAVKVSNDLISKTNIIDPYTIFIEEDVSKKEEENA